MKFLYCCQHCNKLLLQYPFKKNYISVGVGFHLHAQGWVYCMIFIIRFFFFFFFFYLTECTWYLFCVHVHLQVYSEISMVRRNPSKFEHEDVYRMPLLLATIYESARLLPTGSMLQRCSLKHGEMLLLKQA